MTSEKVDKINDLFARVYKALGVSSKDYDTDAHAQELHRLVSLQIAIKNILEGDKE